jgi:hypothetical protein
MTTQPLSPPKLFTPSDLQPRPGLVSAITALINDAFARSKIPDPEKWGETPQKRFTGNESYFELLGSMGIVAVIFDSSADDAAAGETGGLGSSNEGKAVAVAAAVPWQGGWLKEGAGTEDGWEIKAIAVDGGEKYLRKGLSMRLLAALEEKLVQRTREEEPTREELTLWILMAECINGVYWRKRGYREVRRATCDEGVWGCTASFEMVVLRRDVPVRAADRAERCLVQS